MGFLHKNRYPVHEDALRCGLFGDCLDEKDGVYYVKDMYRYLFREYDSEVAFDLSFQHLIDVVTNFVDRKFFLKEKYDLPVVVRKDDEGCYVDLTKGGKTIKTIRPKFKKDSVQEVLGRVELHTGLAVSWLHLHKINEDEI